MTDSRHWIPTVFSSFKQGQPQDSSQGSGQVLSSSWNRHTNSSWNAQNDQDRTMHQSCLKRSLTWGGSGGTKGLLHLNQMIPKAPHPTKVFYLPLTGTCPKLREKIPTKSWINACELNLLLKVPPNYFFSFLPSLASWDALSAKTWFGSKSLSRGTIMISVASTRKKWIPRCETVTYPPSHRQTVFISKGCTPTQHKTKLFFSAQSA